MLPTFTQRELEAFLDEALRPEEMSAIEKQLREDPRLREQLAEIHQRQDAGLHTLGEIWQRHRISCPTREQLGSFLLGTLAAELADYVHFHLEQVGCRICRANVEDLRQRCQENDSVRSTRRSRYFQSSAGYLRRDQERR